MVFMPKMDGRSDESAKDFWPIRLIFHVENPEDPGHPLKGYHEADTFLQISALHKIISTAEWLLHYN